MVSGGVVLALLLLVGTVNAEVVPEVVTLTDATFSESMNTDSLWFVEFYTSWCPFSQMLAPEWARLGADVEVREAGIKVGAVDCDTSKATCLKQKVHGYPSLRVLYNGEKVDDYYGDRDLESLKAFVLQQHAKVAPLKAAAAAAAATANSTDGEGLLRDQRFSVGMVLKLLGF